jgi:hypothetical protein
MTLKFMGQEFDTQDALMKAFPAFGGADALRAIRAGATTPMEVEVLSWKTRRQFSFKQKPMKVKSPRAKAAIAKHAARRRKAA